MSFRCAGGGGHIVAEKIYPVKVITVIRPVEYKIIPPRAKGVFPFTTSGHEIVEEKTLCPACAAKNGSESVVVDGVHYVEHRLRAVADRGNRRDRDRDYEA